jgi:tripartite-type tricarboxylate transporter receptor subunit TctC
MALRWALDVRCARAAAVVAAICAVALAGDTAAQTYPTKPVRVVVPYAAGGITDILARALGQKLGEAFGQPIVIDNRPGANGQVGAEIVARAAPDGYTLMVSADTTFVMIPHLMPKLSYDPLVDFVPVSGLGISPQALVVHPSVPAKSVSDLVALARARPGELNYGTFGIGSSGHLNIELLQSLTGAKFTAVHYKGAAPALTDLIAGRTQMTMLSTTVIVPPILDGRLRPLAVSSTTRWHELPDVPTMAEEGFSDFPQGSWTAVVAPAGTPAEVVAKLNAAINEGLGSAELRGGLTRLGAEVKTDTPAQLGAMMADEIRKWAEVIKSSGAAVN